MPNEVLNHANGSGVTAWEEVVTIPSYPTPDPDPNPMFLEKRVNQGASGRVYPNPLTDYVANNEKADKAYHAVFLENEYLQLMILPEIGGRVHVGFDKTNGYDFFYRQHVIKPALIGLIGSWISGGVEWNWPMHHRPSTFMPVAHHIEKGSDGSVTVWLSDHEPMNRTKGMVGLCLRPGKAFVEARVRLFNRTATVQKFLWWANVAVSVNDQYQIFFPPDVNWVTFHARADMSRWPIARGTFCGIDYGSRNDGQGTDISWWKNSDQATSFFAIESNYDFFGGYDHGKQAGLVHIANHHIAPAKKLFTWGTGSFGQAWERNLTDADGPYAELMAGVYTDNQPDFSWLQPYETKTFSQIWYPIQQIGPAKNANRRAAVNLEFLPNPQGGAPKAKVGVCVTEKFYAATLSLRARGGMVLEQQLDLAPGQPFVKTVDLPEGAQDTDLLLRLRSSDGHEIIRYTPIHPVEKPLPEPASALPAPEEISSNDELYLSGLHLDQYFHPTWSPLPYWQEALRRDPHDARCNNALGLACLQQGDLPQAEQHFRTAINTLTRRNFNPRDGEAYYNLGLTLKYQERSSEAYAAFYKATWSYAWQAAGYYALAEIDCERCDYETALDHLDRSLMTNAVNLKARNLKAITLRRLNRLAEAESLLSETSAMDPLDFWSRNELLNISRARMSRAEADKRLKELTQLMGNQVQLYLDIALDYINAGQWDGATDLLMRLCSDNQKNVYPLVMYALAYIAERNGDDAQASQLYKRAAQMPPDFCFPVRLEEMVILRHALLANPHDARAHYYLGNLLYDKRRYAEAIEHWQASTELEPSFAISWRNLGLGYFNIRKDAISARECYQKAFQANPHDPRLLYELDQLMKRLGEPPAERLARLEAHAGMVQRRDYLAIERVTLLNQLGQPQKALETLTTRRFFPWEGGEGTVSGEYVTAHLMLGRAALEAGAPADALAHFKAAQTFPETLGEGKYGAGTDAAALYWEALAHEALGKQADAQTCYRQVAQVEVGPSPAAYYKALAQRKLGQPDAATGTLNELLAFAQQHMQAEGKFAYFGTSIANVLLFEEDLQKLNRINGGYLLGLAYLGLGQTSAATQAFEAVLALDPNQREAREQLQHLSQNA
jgi:tetratricopeptide (TPR) repeat protein